MMPHSEDQIALAAEYALGTLDAEERAQVEARMADDREFAALVQGWEFRLGSLNQMVGAVEPRPAVWENIKAAIAEPPAPAPPAEPQPPVPAAPVAEPPLPPVPAVDDVSVIDLSGRLKRWRSVAAAASAIAAALLMMLGLLLFLPDALPAAIRPKPRTFEGSKPPSGQLVAVLQQDGRSPAFILTVDAATRNFIARRVGAEPGPGNSFELWLMSDKLPQPRSLGVIGADEFTARPVMASYEAGLVVSATYAVTVEPSGGSPTGQPTSAPIFSGRLIEAVPPNDGAK